MRKENIRAIIVFTTWISFIAMLCNNAIAQDDPHLNVNGDIQIVYPKRRDLRVNPHHGLLAGCKCPDGMHLRWYVVDEMQDKFHVADRACGGVVKKSDMYSLNELDNMDIDQFKDTDEDTWHKILIARHVFDKGTNEAYSEAITIFDNALEKNANDLPVLVHRSYALMRNHHYEASLQGLSFASKLDHSVYEIPYMKGQVLLYKNLMMYTSNRNEVFEEAIKQLKRSLEMAPGRNDTLLLLASCLRHLERFDEILSLLNSIDHIRYDNTREALHIIRAEAYGKSKTPDYEKSLKDFKYVSEQSELFRLCAILNISIIHSTRPDIENQKPEAALEILGTIANNPYLYQNTAGYFYAMCLAHLSLGEYDKAEYILNDLNMMTLSNQEAPDRSSIDDCIKNRRKYLPKHKINLISMSGIKY